MELVGGIGIVGARLRLRIELPRLIELLATPDLLVPLRNVSLGRGAARVHCDVILLTGGGTAEGLCRVGLVVRLGLVAAHGMDGSPRVRDALRVQEASHGMDQPAGALRRGATVFLSDRRRPRYANPSVSTG